jgi:glycosyltransferase involved in cell wall biosynthesis
MKLFIWPTFDKELGQGGIKRVWEAQQRWLPEYGVDLVQHEAQADLVAVHADDYHTDKPVAYHCHGLYWSDYNWATWALEANGRLVRAIKRAAAVSVPSRFVHNVLARGMLLDPSVLYHGVNPEDWEPGGTRGYVLWAKNRPDPICDPAVISQLARLCPDLPFISTFGDDLPNLRLTGKLNFPDAQTLIRGAGVYLASVRETGAITVLEAMAAGVPPVGFRHGVNPEIIEHKVNGYLVEPGDYAGLAEGVRYALANRKELGANARQTILENYQWKDRIRDYIPFYENALAGSSASPTVSVIITAYNLEKYLPAALDSVLAQDFADWEVIVIDDNSPDDCGKIADDYASRDSRIKAIHNRTNAYLAEARNIGIRASSGKYIQCLDADDRFGPATLGVFSQTLDKNPDVDIVTGDFWLVEPDGREWKSGWPPEKPVYDQQIMQRNQVFYASMYRRWVWERTGGYRRRMRSAEDAEFWTRAMSFGAEPVKVTGFPSLIYSNRPDSMSHTEAMPAWNNWYIWKEYPEFTPFGASGTPPQRARSRPVQAYSPLELSVIVPVGPGHDWYLQDCLDSLVSQTMQNWEVILVNDTGVKWLDETGKVINPYLVGYPFARIIDSTGRSQGPAASRNKGIQASTTEAFVLLDADDYAQPLLLDGLYAAWLKYGGWVYPDWFDQEGTPKHSQDWDTAKFRSKMLGPSTGIYSKKAWEAVGGFDEEAPGWEDWNFQLSLVEHGECGLRLAYPGFTYRYQTGMRREQDFSQKETLLQYIKLKHKRFYEDDAFMGSCCGGKSSKKTVIMAAAVDAGDPPADDMVLIEYTGPQSQQVRVNSRVAAGYSYKYRSGDRFYVFNGDAEWLTQNVHFRTVSSPVSALSEEKLNAPVLVAQTPPNAVERAIENQILTEALPVGQLNLPSLVTGILRREGYDTVESLKYASDTELLATKGISDARLKQIRKAIDEL